MDALSQLLGGLGILGVIAGFALGFLFLLILPWWAIFDCLLSRRSGGAKAVGVILLLVTWGFGSLLYGLFVTKSKVFRIATAVGFGGIVLVIAAGTAIAIAGGGIHAATRAEEMRRERVVITEQFKPAAIPAEKIGTFRGLHFTYGTYGQQTAALARFAGAGPDFGSARDTDRGVRQVACDGDGARCWALTAHDVGSIDPSTGRFTPIDVAATLADFSAPRGIAFDSQERKVYVMTSGVFTKFYRYDPETRAWDVLPAEIRGLSIVGLTYSAADGCLYAIEHETHDQAIRRLQRFNPSGASLGPIELRPVVPIREGTEDLFQIHASGGKLVLVLPPERAGAPIRDASVYSGENRTYVVDPATAEVFVPDQEIR